MFLFAWLFVPLSLISTDSFFANEDFWVVFFSVHPICITR